MCPSVVGKYMSQKDEKEIFRVATTINEPTERAAYLGSVCGDDLPLRSRVESLLSASKQGDFIASSPLSSLTDWFDECWKPGMMIGRYKLLEELGEGGFGTVYMAEQVEPINRRVAVKIIKPGMDTRQVISLFEAERQALSMMEHPLIAKILDAGSTPQGRPYFVMEIVRGVPISEHCDNFQLTVSQRLQLIVDICSAVQHAHQKGIIHRDLKPNNILVSIESDRAIPKIIDFGIAKATQGRLTDNSISKDLRRCIGTPIYMSPEQVDDSDCDVDTRTDIYSLGVLMYELLVGSKPIELQSDEFSFDEICRQICDVEPVVPSKRIRLSEPGRLREIANNRGQLGEQLSSIVRGDLDWITMTALEKDRTRRYPTADALAKDIERYLNGEPVTAVPPSKVYRLRKFMHRNRSLVATVFTLAATIVIAAIVATVSAVRATNAQDELHQQVIARDQAVAQARKFAYASDMHRAHQALSFNHLYLARTLLARHTLNGDATDLRNIEWRILWRQCKDDENRLLVSESNAIKRVSVAKNKLAFCVGNRVQVCSAETRRPLWSISVQKPKFVYLTPSGDQLIAVASEGTVSSHFGVSFAISQELCEHGARVRDAFLSGNGSKLAIFGWDDFISIWDINKPRRDPIRLPAGDTSGIGEAEGRVAISHDNRRLAIGLSGRTRVLNLETKEEKLIPHGGKHALAFSPNGNYLAVATGYRDSTIYLYSFNNSSIAARLSGHEFYVSALEFSPNGRFLASGSADQSIAIWDVENRFRMTRLQGHVNEVHCLKFGPNSECLFSGSRDGEIRMWNLSSTMSPKWPISVEEIVSNDFATRQQYAARQSIAGFSSDGKVIATRNPDNSVSLRSAESLEETRKISELGNNNQGVCFSPIEPLLASGDADGVLSLLDITRAGAVNRIKIANYTSITPISFFSDGKRLLLLTSNEAEDKCVLISVAQRKILREWNMPSSVCDIEISPNGEFVATAHHNGMSCLWRESNPSKPIAQWDKRRWGCLAFSPDSKTLLIGTNDPAVAELLDIKSLSVLGRLHGHVLSIHSASFSPDGTRIITGGGAGEPIKIWDVHTKQELLTLMVDVSYIAHVEFSRDGNSILAAAGSQSLHLWRVPTLDEIESTNWDDEWMPPSIEARPDSDFAIRARRETR